MHSGLVFNIQRYSLDDGPGIRTTVFLKGCPLRCIWCHNPEGMDPGPEILLSPARCIACDRCREGCPADAAGPIGQEGRWEDESPRCVRCGACARTCPAEARRLAGRRMTAAEVLAEILRDRVFYEDSGGGATFSGGEPLMQPEFLMALLAACRDREIHTAVDTSGYARQEDLLAAARSADLFLYDLKILDDQRHRRYTGVSNRSILENLHALGQVHGNIWVRMPLVPGVNDGPGDLEDVVRLAASVPGVRQVNLLPYHATGAAKFRRLGKAYPGDALVTPPAELVEQTAARLQNLGVPVISGG
ncbi:MAG: glycyl-radical enzyme activating protein [Thermoguttaceae bacterium]|jgi:pyruvate formate lyase activating enzyme